MSDTGLVVPGMYEPLNRYDVTVTVSNRGTRGSCQAMTIRHRSSIAVPLSWTPIGRSRVGGPPTAGPRGDGSCGSRGGRPRHAEFPRNGARTPPRMCRAGPESRGSAGTSSVRTSGMAVVGAGHRRLYAQMLGHRGLELQGPKKGPGLGMAPALSRSAVRPVYGFRGRFGRS